MTQDQSVILALKVVLIAGFVSLTASVAVYTRLTRWAAWRNPVGRTLMAKSLLLAMALVPTTLSLFFTFNRLTSHIAGWVDVALIGAITPVMLWRCLIWVKISRKEDASRQRPAPGENSPEAPPTSPR